MSNVSDAAAESVLSGLPEEKIFAELERRYPAYIFAGCRENSASTYIAGTIIEDYGLYRILAQALERRYLSVPLSEGSGE